MSVTCRRVAGSSACSGFSGVGPSVPVLLTVPEGHNAVIFVRSGELTIGAEGSEQRIGPQSVALMEREGQSMRVMATIVLSLSDCPNSTQLIDRLQKQPP